MDIYCLRIFIAESPYMDIVQVISHLKRIRLVSVRSSLPCFKIGVRIELIFILYLLCSLY